MGKNANKRTPEERAAYAAVLQDDSWEVIFRIKESDEKNLEVNVIIRDSEHDDENKAHVFAQFLHANMGQLIGEAIQGHQEYKERLAAGQSQEEAANAPALRLAEAPHRSILGADGNIARRTDDVELILPPGVRREEPETQSEPAVVSGQGGDFGGGGASGSYERPSGDSGSSSSDSSASGGD